MWRKRHLWHLIGLVVLVGALGIACASQEPTPLPTATTAPAVAPTSPPAATATTVVVQTVAPTSAPVATAAPAQSPTAAVPTAEPSPGKYGGVLRYGMAPNTEHLFFVPYSGGAGAAWAMTVGDPLTAYGPDSEWFKEKSMAESFEVGADGKSVVFHLKRGVKFHDGTDFNAEAMKFSLDWALDPQNPVIYAPSINAIKEVKVIDAYTMSIHMERVFAPIITNLGMIVGMPFSPTAFKERGREGFHTKPVGTGPFMVKEWITGSHATFEKFPQYHRKGRPYLDAWQWMEIPDDRVRSAAMQAKELELASISASATDSIKAIREIQGIQEFKGYGGPSLDHYNAGRPPFDDIRVRQAAQMAIDRKAWNTALAGGEGYIYRGSVLPPGHAASFEVPEDQFPYPYNPEKAKQLLEEYAREKGLKLPLDTLGPFTCTPEQKALGCHDLRPGPITMIATSTRANVARAEFSKAYYEAVGFKIELVLGAGQEEQKTFTTKEAGFSLRGFGLRPHPSGTLDSYFGMGGNLNAGGWGTSAAQVEMDRLIKAASATYDMAEQNKLYKEAQKIYMEAALGGVKTGNAPSFWFAQPLVKWDQWPDPKWVRFNSDNSVKVYDLWLDK